MFLRSTVHPKNPGTLPDDSSWGRCTINYEWMNQLSPSAPYRVRLTPGTSQVYGGIQHGDIFEEIHQGRGGGVGTEVWPPPKYAMGCQDQPNQVLFKGDQPICLPRNLSMSSQNHRLELLGNYPVFTMVMVIYHYFERIWRILVAPIFYIIFMIINRYYPGEPVNKRMQSLINIIQLNQLMYIYNNEWILFRRTIG